MESSYLAVNNGLTGFASMIEDALASLTKNNACASSRNQAYAGICQFVELLESGMSPKLADTSIWPNALPTFTVDDGGDEVSFDFDDQELTLERVNEMIAQIRTLQEHIRGERTNMSV